METLSDEVASFRISRKVQTTAASATAAAVHRFSNGSSVVAKENGTSSHSKHKKRSRSPLLIFSYLALISIAGYVQYLGGVNEFVVELMSLTYTNYGLLHGGSRVYVDTDYGKLKGFTSVSREGREFYEFLGIPYASPPVDELRFQVCG